MESFIFNKSIYLKRKSTERKRSMWIKLIEIQRFFIKLTSALPWDPTTARETCRRASRAFRRARWPFWRCWGRRRARARCPVRFPRPRVSAECQGCARRPAGRSRSWAPGSCPRPNGTGVPSAAGPSRAAGWRRSAGWIHASGPMH